MQLKNQVKINAPRDKVFESLNDPEVLKQAIPGCEEMVRSADSEFSATVVTKIGPMKITFKGAVTMSNIVPPESYTLTGKGMGGTQGFAKIKADISLSEDVDATLLTYDVKVDVGGKLAQLGGRMIEGVSKKRASEFFEKFEEIIGGDLPNAGNMSPEAVESSNPLIPFLYWAAGALILGSIVFAFV